MHQARYPTFVALLGCLCLAIGPSAGCGGDDDDDDDAGAGGDGGNGGGDGGGGSEADASPPRPDAAVADCEPVSGTNLALEKVGEIEGEPLFVTSPPGDRRLFVVDKGGAIFIIDGGQVLEQPFLAIADRVAGQPADNEQGLLGLAFHPDFAQNGRFFVYYTADGAAEGVPERISEFRVSDGDPNVADPASERPILEVADNEPNHNGGMIAFGPDDGYLYIGLGDGGGAGDQHGAIGNGQDKTTLLGDILRIDVDVEPDQDPAYSIPTDNPYAASMNGERPEIFISGVRNPWRWSFDRETFDLYIGDVGQGAWEEVDVLPAGQQAGVNLGWRIMEGEDCYPPGTSGCNETGLTLPVDVYANPPGDEARAVTGGYVYRGSCFPDLVGTYFYGDYVTAQVWTFRYTGGPVDSVEVTGDLDPDGTILNGLSSFGEDATGELYAVSLGTGEVFHIVAGP